MKKIIKKINSSKILFTLFITLIFLAFMMLTNSLGGIVEKWLGLNAYLTMFLHSMINNTYFGIQVIYELFWIILLIPIILIFKNKYIFKQKHDNFFKVLIKAWPIWLFSIITLAVNIFSISFENIKFIEVITLLIYTIEIGIFEELLCRGWLLNEFIERFGDNRKNVLFSILVSGSLFGIIHIVNFVGGQPLIMTLAQILGAIFAGIAFGAIYYRTKNIWSVIFLHALWDFSIMFGEINSASVCVNAVGTVENASIILGLFYLFNIMFTEIPVILTAVLFLRKSETNLGLPKDKMLELTSEQKKEDRTLGIVLKIVLVIYILLYFTISLFSIIGSSNNDSDACPTYLEKQESEYSETYLYYKDYEINVSRNDCNVLECIDNNYRLKIEITDNNKLKISNLNTSNEILLEYENVNNLIVFENNGVYNILILNMNKDGNNVVYLSSFIKTSNISNDINYLNSIKDSFSQVLVPSIIKIGYYQEKGDINRYPLFISSINERYVLQNDGKIYKYTGE